MPTATAVLVGVNQVDPQSLFYAGAAKQYGAPNSEQNIVRMQAILREFNCHLLPTQQATAQAITAALRGAAQGLVAGDILVFYFAGHALDPLVDNIPTSLAAFDQPLAVGDILPILFACPAGVRIVVICDACHAGEMDFAPMLALTLHKFTGHLMNLFRPAGAASPPPLIAPKAQVIYYAATQNNSVVVGGEFSDALFDVWNGGFNGNYRTFLCQILARMKQMNASELPSYVVKGPVTDTFEQQQPFTTAAPAASTTIVTKGANSNSGC